MATISFKTLLYRYYFFDWLFLDVNQGDLYQRALAYRHNQAQARWLATYLRRWLFISALCCSMGALSEGLMLTPLVSALFFVPMAVSISINTVIGALMLGFKTVAHKE